MSEAQPLFHLAFPVTDLDRTRQFYTGILGCTTGRTDESWLDFNLFGHQITAHLVDKMPGTAASNTVDGKQVPVTHFGVILDMASWETLADRLSNAGVEFIIEPGIRFRGEAGEQATLFFVDPCGNALEFKAFTDPSRIFASQV